MTELSVLIPTCQRPDKIAACCSALAEQTLGTDRFEVLVGVDGPDTGERALIAQALPRARVEAFEHGGPAATRNKLVARASGDIVLFLNDDVTPRPDCLATHVEAHRDASAPAMMLGAAPWRVHEPDRLFDRLIRETSMIFFYDRMDSQTDRDWGFRHAWTLNLSIRSETMRESGGFDDSLPCACFEDLEWAWRVSRMGVALRYRPAAVVEHDHRYEPAQYLARERMLGREAVRLERAAPECAHALFGKSLLSDDELAYSRAFVERERRDVERLERSFVGLADLPANTVEGQAADRLIELLYQQHLLVKRWHWRSGLLEERQA